MNGGSVVVLRDVTKTFRRGSETVVAVSRASVEVEAATVTVVRGPSGSGKTTLLNLVLGWEDPDEGERIGPTGTTRWTDVAVVPQRLGLLAHLTVEENVLLPGRVDDLALDAVAMMERLAIAHLARRFPGETSLGEQQRIACARALVSAPRLLVADEPTSHQDEVNTARITAELLDAAARGSAVVVATHDPRVASRATHRFDMTDGIVTRVS